MQLSKLHEWNLDYREAVVLQQQLAAQLIECPVDVGKISTIAGVDISTERRSSVIHGAVVVHERPSLAIVEEATVSLEVPFPYIPGLLSFREGPAVVAVLERLSVKPDMVIFDGQGYAHPRRMGLACHLGLWLGVPTVGCAKTRLIGEYEPPPGKRGGRSILTHEGEEVGAVLTTREGVKPVFVSRGHLCDLESAVKVILGTAIRFRLPEPIRSAHALCNRQRLSFR